AASPSNDPWDMGAFSDEPAQSQRAASSPPPAQSRPGLTGALPWRQGVSEPADQPQAAPLADGDANDISWMSEPDASPQSSAPEPASSGTDWMSDAASSSPFDQPDAGTSTPEPQAAASPEADQDWAKDFDFQDTPAAQPAQSAQAPEPAASDDWMADLDS